MLSYAEVVSSFALATAVASLGWQVIRARAERPAVAVSLGINHMWTNKSPDYQVRVTVANSGGRAVTLIDLDWEYPGTTPIQISFWGDRVQGPELPYRLEPYDAVRWTFPSSFIEEILDANRPVSALAIYQSRPNRRGMLRRLNRGPSRAVSRAVVLNHETAWPPHVPHSESGPV